MDLKDLDFLIYSSHKTATQSLKKILSSTFNINHIHTLLNLKGKAYQKIRNHVEVTKDNFIQGLVNYKHINHKKLKIITSVRNPKDRLISSFFQSYHDDEIHYLGKNKNETTINTKNEKELIILYKNGLINKTLPGFRESIHEMSWVFDTNIIKHLEKKEHHYYFDHDLFELYVLDFNQLIIPHANIYLNHIFNINTKQHDGDNLSIKKSYYHKYKNMKNTISKLDINSTIETYFDKFYFTAF